MIEDLGGITSKLARLALDASLLRHQVIANNIANADTPGFAAKRVNFEEQLAKFMQINGELDDSALEKEFQNIKASIDEGHAVVQSDSEKVELDREMIDLTKNVIRYRAILEALSKRGAVLKMAIKEGRQ